MKQFILGTMLVVMAFSAHAGIQDKDRGGGNGVNGQLFDFYENSGTDEIDFDNAAVFQELVVPILKQLEASVPKFVPVLTESLRSKHWYLEPKEIESDGCVNSSMIKVEKVILACQSEFEVRMDRRWVEQMTKKDPKQVAGLLIHEMLVAMRMKDERISEESIRFMNRLFFSAKFPSAEVIQDNLDKRSFGKFATSSEISAAKQEIHRRSVEFARSCSSSTAVIKFTQLSNLIQGLSSSARDARYPDETQSQMLETAGTLLRLQRRMQEFYRCGDVLSILRDFSK